MNLDTWAVHAAEHDGLESEKPMKPEGAVAANRLAQETIRRHGLNKATQKFRYEASSRYAQICGSRNCMIRPSF
ncbi:hypothetical protein [Saccharibacillus sacchari]|uniref:Uncharacterized protein n=1 Tax=Saccharibacillus sacchari TaxID=456493 RepID=A0ACC6PBG1_9BACL